MSPPAQIRMPDVALCPNVTVLTPSVATAASKTLLTTEVSVGSQAGGMIEELPGNTKAF